MKFSRRHISKRNTDGKGFVLKRGFLTTFEERKLFLKSRFCNYYKTDEKSAVRTVRTDTEADLITSSTSTTGSKRKFDDKSKEDEFIEEEAGSCVKRIKNESNDPNNLINEGEKTSVEELLFSNDLLLRIIFPNLSVTDLKSCRQVNRLWYFEASKILLKRDNLASIQISNNTVGFYNAPVYKSPISLQDFQNILANSELFPATSFSVAFHSFCDNSKEFFRDHGHLVKSLCLENIHYKKKKTTVYDILSLAANYLPNLQILELKGDLPIPMSTKEEENVEMSCPEMSNLRTLVLKVKVHPRVISLIVKKAGGNLESIYFHTRRDAIYISVFSTWLQFENIIPHLKNIKFSLFQNCLEIFQKVVEQKPQFKSIEDILVDPEDEPSRDLAQVGRFLTEMFEQCSESLTEFVGFKPLGHIPGLIFPAFPNVKRLGLEFNGMPISSAYPSPMAPLLPSGVNLAETFPNLITVEMLSSALTDVNPDDVLPKLLSPLLSVRHLKVDGLNTGAWVEKICSWFPNVTSVKFDYMLYEEAYPHIWKLSRLQALHLTIFTEEDIEDLELCLELDCAFTGFSVETAKSLWKKDEAELNLSAEEVAALRINPSIVDLKELRKLSVSLGLYGVMNGNALSYDNDSDGDDFDEEYDDLNRGVEVENVGEDNGVANDNNENSIANLVHDDNIVPEENNALHENIVHQDNIAPEENFAPEENIAPEENVVAAENIGDDNDEDDDDVSEDSDDNLQERNLEVIFDKGDAEALLKVNGKTILSNISKRFGFDLCPLLKSNVFVKFTHYTIHDSEANEAQ